MRRLAFAAAAAAMAMAVPAAAWTGPEDIVLAAVIDGVDVRIVIPGDAKVIRGVIVHAANYKMNPQDRWAETCRAMRFAHVALNMDLKRTNRPITLRKALDEGLKEFAATSGHPELLNVPFVGTGHSAGGLVTSALLRTPERTITNTVSCGWIMDPAKVEFFDGDRLLGAAGHAPWQFTWKAQQIAQGPHALYAVWTAGAPKRGVPRLGTPPDGRRGTTSPALIVRRGRTVAQPASEPARPQDDKRRP